MADRFQVRQTRRGISAGYEPLVDGAVGVAGGGQMMSQELWLALCEIGELLDQRNRDAGMQFLTFRAKQGGVCGVLHQRVLEEIGGLWRLTAAEQQPGFAKSLKPGLQFGTGALCHPL